MLITPHRFAVRPTARLLMTLLVSAVACGCQTTEFYQRGRLAGPLMSLEEDPTETHFQQKCFYSREGSIGGIGTSAGGGCGCY